MTAAMPITRRALIAGAAGSACVPGPARADAGPPAPRLRRGVNLHNLLNWPDTTGQGASLRYAWPPFAAARFRMTPAAMAALRAAGFDFVRVTVDPSIFIATEPARQPELARHLLQVVHALLDAGLSVVVDLHPVAVNPAYRPEALVDPGRPEAFAAYLDMVGRVAAALSDLPVDRVALELFNEPPIGSVKEAPRWQAMLEQLHGRARAADGARALVLNGVGWDNLTGLLALDLRPFRGSNVLYTFHYYDPKPFTHQGAATDTKWFHGLRWPEDDGNVRDTLGRALGAIATGPALGAADRAEAIRVTQNYAGQLLANHPTPATIRDDFASVSRWAGAHGIAPGRILLGEFGCVADPASPADRTAWLTAVRRTSEAAGFAWAYWAYSGFGGMTLLDNKTGALDPATLDALGLGR